MEAHCRFGFHPVMLGSPQHFDAWDSALLALLVWGRFLQHG